MDNLQTRIEEVLNKAEENRHLLGRCANLHPDSKEPLNWIINYLLHSIHADSVTAMYGRKALEYYPILLQLIRDMAARNQHLEAENAKLRGIIDDIDVHALDCGDWTWIPTVEYEQAMEKVLKTQQPEKE